MRLIEQVVAVAGQPQLARRTVDCYVGRIRNFLRFCRGSDGAWRHPRESGAADVERFLNHLVLKRRCSMWAG